MSAFENALEPLGTKRVARAFIVEKAADGIVEIIEGLAGRLPSDPEEYVPEANPSGRYLVGSIAPRAGYTIADRKEERFCVRLSPHGTYVTGPDLNELMWLSDIAERLKQQPSESGSNGD